MNEQGFLGILYQLDVQWRYDQLCHVLANQQRTMISSLRPREAVQRYFAGARSHSLGLHWTYHRTIDRYQLGIVLQIPLKMTLAGVPTTFMLVLRWDTQQVSAVPMRNISRRISKTHYRTESRYAQVFNQTDLEEVLLFSRVLYDDVYTAIVHGVQQ